jgi:hypothetical protein
VRSTGGRPSDGCVTRASLACVPCGCAWPDGRYDAHVTTTEPGDRRPQLDRPPGDRYLPREAGRSEGRIAWPPIAVAVGGALAYTILGGILSITAGLIVVAGFAGWLLGKLVAGPPKAAGLAIITIVVGLLGIWLFSRIEGGALDPLSYLDEVQGWPLVLLQLGVGGGLAAASSR